MDDVAHDDEAIQLDVAGYRSCRNEWCGELILVEVGQRTGGLCTQCFRSDLGSKLAEVEVRNRARVIPLALTRERSVDKGNKATHVAANKARKNASTRLRMMFPELYEVLLAEERARFGLEPFPIETAIHEGPDGDLSQSIAFARVYDALDEQGVDVDGLDPGEAAH